ncbi:MAG TPA: hypothetical protein VM054_00925 [bacterium]|nr:hypothetical protein [bacterium]
MEKQRIWLSYDLGIEGDYESMYFWLDSHEARECGDSVASFVYIFRHDLIEEIKSDLEANVNLRKKDRVYIIFYDTVKKSLRGGFIFGGRKRHAPWFGYAIRTTPEEDY